MDGPCPEGEFCSMTILPPGAAESDRTRCLAALAGAGLGSNCAGQTDCPSDFCTEVLPSFGWCFNFCTADHHCGADSHCVIRTSPGPDSFEYGVCLWGGDGHICDDTVADWCVSGSCGASGTCCSPDCAGKDCGSDGCGGACGGPCDDGIVCTTDACGGGSCKFAPHDYLCDDGSGCTIDACNTQTGCEVAPGNPCTDAHKGVCVDNATAAVCSCDAGYGDDDGIADDSGVCKSTTPCAPNPCQDPDKATCKAAEFDYTCTCTNTDAVMPDCIAPCPNHHLDGDQYEPNDCATHATALPINVAGAFGGTTVSANIGPTNSDEDWLKLSDTASKVCCVLQVGHVYSGLSTTTMDAPIGSFTRSATYSGSNVPAPLGCTARGVGPNEYSFRVVEFTPGPDGSDSAGSPTSIGTTTKVSDSLQANWDDDCYESTFSLPATFYQDGRGATDGLVRLERCEQRRLGRHRHVGVAVQRGWLRS
ncbi:MAG: hypothetical protein ACI9OJ_004539 [Myxococcota bacterium]|jgi:hypothetical protein